MIFGRSIARRLDRIERVLLILAQKDSHIMAQLDDLKAALAEEDKDIDAILAMVSSENAQIADLTQKLADAIAAGSPDLAPLIAGVQAKVAAMAAVLPAAPASAPAA